MASNFYVTIYLSTFSTYSAAHNPIRSNHPVFADMKCPLIVLAKSEDFDSYMYTSPETGMIWARFSVNHRNRAFSKCSWVALQCRFLFKYAVCSI